MPKDAGTRIVPFTYALPLFYNHRHCVEHVFRNTFKLSVQSLKFGLHAFEGDPYLLGVFLIGAYQEILGDLHNLFGDPHAVHVSLSPNNEVVLDTMIKGETVAEVLGYVQYSRDTLITRLQAAAETAVQEGLIDHKEAGRFIRFYEDGLNGYTYLKETPDS